MNKDTSMLTISVDDVVEILAKCQGRDWHTDDALAFASDLTGISEDALWEMVAEEDTAELIGFVWKHGEHDISAHQVDLTPEDSKAIKSILEKYENHGCSLRNVYSEKFSSVFV